MKNIKLFSFGFSMLATTMIYADDLPFEKQLHYNTCGSASLNLLIKDKFSDVKITEDEIINVIKKFSLKESGDYSFKDLFDAAKILGFEGKVGLFTKESLSKLKEPVILLINANKIESETEHFVVLERVELNKENELEVYIKDPIFGKIHRPYKDLIKSSISNENPKFLVMGLKNMISNFKLKSEKENFDDYISFEESIAINSATLSKKGQIITWLGYQYTSSRYDFENLNTKVNSKKNTESIGIRYGLTDSIEIGNYISYTDVKNKIINDVVFTNFDEELRYEVFLNKKFLIDDLSKGFIFGFSSSTDKKIISSEANFSAFTHIDNIFVTLSTSIQKPFSDKKELPEYVVGGGIELFKPIYDNNFFSSISFFVQDGKNKNSNPLVFERKYTTATSISYLFDQVIQITPRISYSFGGNEEFLFGLNLSYIGKW